MIANFASMQSKDIAYQVTRNYIVVFYFIGIYHDISHNAELSYKVIIQPSVYSSLHVLKQ